MHYLLLVYMNETRWAALPESERERVYADCHGYGRELTQSGNFISGAPLEASATARTIRSTEGKAVVTDGPFAETKEVLAGYHLVVCKDMAEAVALGERFPGLRAGMTVEVRALMGEPLTVADFCGEEVESARNLRESR